MEKRVKPVNQNPIKIYPGFIVKQELKERGIRQNEFAELIGVLPSHLSELLKGKKNMSDAMAEKIAKALNMPFQHLVDMQAEYECYLKKIKNESDAENIATIWLEKLNESIDVKQLFRLLNKQMLPASEKVEFCKTRLLISDNAYYSNASGYYHKSEKTGLDKRMIDTWTILAKYHARETPKPNGNFDNTELDKMADELAVIFHHNQNTMIRVYQKLSEYGIKFCVVPKVDKASIDGYSFIENGIPSLIVTQRYNRIDNFAFAVLHEVAHLKLHLTNENEERISFASYDDEQSKEEREANDYAADKLIADELWSKAPEVSMNPVAIQKTYSRWAELNGKNKWIVLGRVSHETGMYKFKPDDSRIIQ